MKFYFVLFIFFIFQIDSIFAQRLPFEKTKWIKTNAKKQKIDTSSIIPNSIKIIFPTDVVTEFSFDFQTNTISIPIFAKYDSVKISYQTLPFHITQKMYLRKTITRDSIKGRYTTEDLSQTITLIDKREEFFNLGNINKSGSLVRGISIGNTQNVFVNSALNLQLEGKLNNDITLNAVINDQNIPYQPDGNTLQVQEFDRVFIKLSHKKGNITAGDVVFQQKKNYFLQFYKNGQGAFLDTDYAIKDYNAKTTAGFAASKGKFASITLNALEGVQGPYRLQSPNGEKLLIVLANSEKVFVDGKLMTRGYNNDYTIDYNQAEIIFTPSILITQFSRIRVDFEYAERNYARGLQTFWHQQAIKKTNFFVGFYREADNPRTPLITLSDADKLTLSESGDGNGFINGIDSVGFRANEILYQKKDTLIGLVTYPILEYSNNPDKAIFRVSFTEVGNNKGDYVRLSTTANGQIFEWRQPINNIKQGNFMPVRQVPTPLLKQMLVAGVKYNFNEYENIFIENAFSNLDVNRYSNKDDADNQGFATKFGYQNSGKKIKNTDWQWFGKLDFEHNSQFFRPIDRFREIEFDRDWSLRSDTIQIADNIAQAEIGIKQKNNHFFSYKINLRNRGIQANGTQQVVNLQTKYKNFNLKINAFWLANRQDIYFSDWKRVNIELKYNTRKGSFGYQFNQDKNKVFLQKKDSIIRTAMNFEEQKIFFQLPDSSKIKWQIQYSWRTDFMPKEGKMQSFLQSQTANTSLKANINATNQITINLTYRNLQYKILQSIQGNTENDNIMGRLDWNGFLLGKLIKNEFSLATNTGRELQREYQFVPVAIGQGTHTWRDDNNDRIPQLNEFYLAINPDERQYIKIFLPTTTYTKAFSNNFNYRLEFNFPKKWADSKHIILKNIAKISNQTAWNIQKRFTEDDFLNRLIPFRNIDDAQILATQEVIRTTFFYNRLSTFSGAELQLLATKQKQLLTNGFEERQRAELKLVIRRNIGKFTNLRLNLAQYTQKNASDFLLTRNFLIQSYHISPEIAFQPSNDFRISLILNYQPKKNIFDTQSNEKNTIKQIITEIRWNKLSTRNLLATIRYIQNDFSGNLNTPVSYELLEALQPNVNFTWTLNWQQKLSNGLQLNLNYEGRKSGEIPIIHIGRVQVAVLF
ncbi:MAG: hypothetical protein EAZ06_09400 [Cytophagales bacterium]|nr:MAG: hypothetical protein EAZ06_09400 [Cytophagales bacterium]